MSDVTSLYDDLPYVSLKAVVPDRHIIKVSSTEQEVLEPEGKPPTLCHPSNLSLGLQEQIEAVFKQYDNARCFVRPSGTEDLVRVFVQAANPDHLLLIGNEVVELVKNHPVIAGSGQ